MNGFMKKLLASWNGEDSRKQVREEITYSGKEYTAVVNRLNDAYKTIGGYCRFNTAYCHQLTALNRAHQKSLAVIRALRAQRKREQVETRERLARQIVDALDAMITPGDKGDDGYYDGLAAAIDVVAKSGGIEYRSNYVGPIRYQEPPVAGKYFIQYEGEDLTEAVSNHFNDGFMTLLEASAEAENSGEGPFNILNDKFQVVAIGQGLKK